MVEINWAAAGVIMTGLVSFIGLAAWVGTISERIKHHSEKIRENEEEAKNDRGQNRQDHQIIFNKLDALRELINDRQ